MNNSKGREIFIPDQVSEAIKKARGIESQAALIIGCNRQTITNYIDSYPELKETYESARDDPIDLAENKLIKKITARGVTSIIFTLKNIGSDVEWNEK